MPSREMNPFTDVAANADYHNAVLWALENGVTAGTSPTTFSPELTVNHGQAMTFLYRVAGSPVVDGDRHFSDVNEDDYYQDAITWAAAEKITSWISDTALGPGQSCTYGQILTFLYCYMER